MSLRDSWWDYNIMRKGDRFRQTWGESDERGGVRQRTDAEWVVELWHSLAHGQRVRSSSSSAAREATLAGRGLKTLRRGHWRCGKTQLKGLVDDHDYDIALNTERTYFCLIRGVVVRRCHVMWDYQMTYSSYNCSHTNEGHWVLFLRNTPELIL